MFGLNSTPSCLSCIQDLDLASVGNYAIIESMFSIMIEFSPGSLKAVRIFVFAP